MRNIVNFLKDYFWGDINIEKQVAWALQIHDVMSMIWETSDSNPLVCSLMSEIFIDRQPLSRCLFEWNEKLVLIFTKVVASSSKILSDKN